MLEEREIVTPTYREALITREKSFPTGLDMEFLGKDLPNVAIPHTDIVHNLAEKVVVVRLEKPVTFHNMIAPDKEVEVSLLFFIINNSSSSQTNILAQLMDFFTGNGHLEDLSKISLFLNPRLRISFHTCSMGFISGVYGGINAKSILVGIFKVLDLCHIALSITSKR
ncbi:phosphotransferase system sugar-specific EII component [Streptococcus pneumoniae]|nr:phosphotransferase system sugar-specific EII component [Streptococcus pneumoniae]